MFVPSSSLDLFTLERPLLDRGEVVVGIDEVGRGALAGPMAVGAVVVRQGSAVPQGVADSKVLSATRRASLVEPLQSWAAEWSLGWVSAAEIDSWGVRLALAVAATRALDALTLCPSHVLIDGPFNILDAPCDLFTGGEAPVPDLHHSRLAHTTVIRGDSLSAAIAAASILAKVERDRVMCDLHLEFPFYDWASNKGYGTAKHLAALQGHGASVHHRRSWRLPTKTYDVLGRVGQ